MWDIRGGRSSAAFQNNRVVLILCVFLYSRLPIMMQHIGKYFVALLSMSDLIVD